MNLITSISNDPHQRLRLVLADKSRATLTLNYSPQQRGWFFDIEYGGNFALTGTRLVSSPNLLRQWRHVLPFGLTVLTKGKSEPMRQNDFADETVKLYLIEGDDIITIERKFFQNDEGIR
jgi:hypothetical protein